MRGELTRCDIEYALDLLYEGRQKCWDRGDDQQAIRLNVVIQWLDTEFRRAPAARLTHDDDANRLERIQDQMDDARNREIREDDHLGL
jgi:hypothetical protein